MLRAARRLLKDALLGPAGGLQKCYLGLHNPQTEVAAWLVGKEDRLNVTGCHFMACGAPLLIGVGFEQSQQFSDIHSQCLRLRFCRRTGEPRLLGEIRLEFDSSLPFGDSVLGLFRIARSSNRSLPRLQVLAHSMLHERARRQSKDFDVPITASDARAMAVFYLCPRPIAVVTVGDRQGGNLFPMNLMGPLGGDFFAFALNSSRAVAPLVDQVGRIALSAVPLEQASTIASLGKNHRRSSIDWDQLPFPIIRPNRIDAPVPSFALNVCEMQVETVHRLGSHTLFIARVTAREHLAEGLQLFVAHGMYEASQRRYAPDNS
jgi:flavin reductase (DIM6/NTAB) family NADH-FMN oxidoreductase RutF